MNLPTLVVLLLVAAVVFLVGRHLWKRRGQGCAGCPGKDACRGCHGACGGSCHTK